MHHPEEDPPMWWLILKVVGTVLQVAALLLLGVALGKLPEGIPLPGWLSTAACQSEGPDSAPGEAQSSSPGPSPSVDAWLVVSVPDPVGVPGLSVEERPSTWAASFSMYCLKLSRRVLLAGLPATYWAMSSRSWVRFSAFICSMASMALMNRSRRHSSWR